MARALRTYIRRPPRPAPETGEPSHTVRPELLFTKGFGLPAWSMFGAERAQPVTTAASSTARVRQRRHQIRDACSRSGIEDPPKALSQPSPFTLCPQGTDAFEWLPAEERERAFEQCALLFISRGHHLFLEAIDVVEIEPEPLTIE